MFNHAYTLAFEVRSAASDEATFEEWLAGLKARVAQPEYELRQLWETDLPFDSYEEDEELPAPAVVLAPTRMIVVPVDLHLSRRLRAGPGERN